MEDERLIELVPENRAWNIEWWAYTLLALTVFFAFLLINYIVNKINEAHLEDRLMILQDKSPAGQVTQVQETILDVQQVQLKTSDKNFSILKPDPQVEITEVTGKELVESEETPLLLGSIYVKPDDVVSKLEIIELRDVAESAQLDIPAKEKTESNVTSTSNEDLSKISQSKHSNNTVGKTISNVDKPKSWTL